MWFVLCHVDVDAMYLCKSREQNMVCVVSEKAVSTHVFGFIMLPRDLAQLRWLKKSKTWCTHDFSEMISWSLFDMYSTRREVITFWTCLTFSLRITFLIFFIHDHLLRSLSSMKRLDDMRLDQFEVKMTQISVSNSFHVRSDRFSELLACLCM